MGVHQTAPRPDDLRNEGGSGVPAICELAETDRRSSRCSRRCWCRCCCFLRFVVIAPVGPSLAAIPSLARGPRLVVLDESRLPPRDAAVDGAAHAAMGDRDAGVLRGRVRADVCGRLPGRTLYVWFGVLTFVSFFNTLRVLGAHEYESDGSPRDRHEQLEDSIDTPGGVLDRALGAGRTALSRAASLLPGHPVPQSRHRLPANRRGAAGGFAVPPVDQPQPAALVIRAVAKRRRPPAGASSAGRVAHER